MEDLKNQDMEQMNSEYEEKLFTQDEVNEIVSKRLARNNKSKNEELEERERNITQRELKADCKEILSNKSLPLELSDYFKGSSEDDLNEFIDLIDKISDHFKKNDDKPKFIGHEPKIASDRPPFPPIDEDDAKIKAAFKLFR